MQPSNTALTCIFQCFNLNPLKNEENPTWVHFQSSFNHACCNNPNQYKAHMQAYTDIQVAKQFLMYPEEGSAAVTLD